MPSQNTKQKNVVNLLFGSKKRHGDFEVLSSCQGILDSSVPRSTAIANEIPVWKNGPSLLSMSFSTVTCASGTVVTKGV